MSELWLYEWPNGQASIVHAEDEEDAALILEQLGPTDSSEVQPYDGESTSRSHPYSSPRTVRLSGRPTLTTSPATPSRHS